MAGAVTELVSPAAVQDQLNVTVRDNLSFIEANKNLSVIDLESLTRANEIRKWIGERQRFTSEQLDLPKKSAYGLHRWLCSLETSALAPLTAFDKFVRGQIITFNDAQTRARAERERVLAEAQHVADQARATAEAAALERAGEHKLAAAVVEEAIAAPLPIVHLEDDVKAIQSFRRTWHYEITNEALVPRAYCTPDLKKLQAAATSMKGTGDVPGVRFYFTDDPIR